MFDADGAFPALSEPTRNELRAFIRLLNLDTLSQRQEEFHSITGLQSILKRTHDCIEHRGRDLNFEDKWLLVQFLVAVELWTITQDRIRVIEGDWSDDILEDFISTTLNDLGFTEEDT